MKSLLIPIQRTVIITFAVFLCGSCQRESQRSEAPAEELSSVDDLADFGEFSDYGEPIEVSAITATGTPVTIKLTD